MKGKTSRADRLFRAAVSAYCSLTRPSRREIAQLEDLAFPLFDAVSVEARRYAAAALSECEHPPVELVRRLCDEPIDIAAPLLIRSNSLRDIDLIALIGRHGLPHARAIARRQSLNPTIADLIRMMEGPRLVHPRQPGEQTTEPQDDASAGNRPAPVPGASADNARQQLRAMMRRPHASRGVAAYARLRDAALSGSALFFQAVLAEALDIAPSMARAIAGADDHSALLAALRSLDLSEEQAFVIAAAALPGKLSQPEAIRLTLNRYRALEPVAAREQVQTWKAQATEPKRSNLKAS
ncbi:hypothetical protein [Pseudaminobacter sp. NGMCC 1.201702]|uniref:hypothetical protein n=1 Tax=Pseudaminobacter sp. NGMCC 1.201702 TaxID=3391825 RepID=UPI0039EF9F42